MSITVGAPLSPAYSKTPHAHMRPNPSNPLVQIKRDCSPEAVAEQEAKEAAQREQLRADTAKLTDLNAPTPTKPSLPMPERFRQPELWADSAPRQHPLYRTSANVYGARPPATQEMQHVYYGNSQKFTKSFAGGMARDYSLNTAITKPRVNGAQEDIGLC